MRDIPHPVTFTGQCFKAHGQLGELLLKLQQLFLLHIKLLAQVGYFLFLMQQLRLQCNHCIIHGQGYIRNKPRPQGRSRRILQKRWNRTEIPIMTGL